jgi:hypothetical protein
VQCRADESVIAGVIVYITTHICVDTYMCNDMSMLAGDWWHVVALRQGFLPG